MRDASCWEAPSEYTLAGMATQLTQEARRAEAMKTYQRGVFTPEAAARGRANAKRKKKAING